MHFECIPPPEAKKMGGFIWGKVFPIYYSHTFLLDPACQVASIAQGAICQVQLDCQPQPLLDKGTQATVTYALVTSQLDDCRVFYMELPLKTVQKLHASVEYNC